MLSDKEHAVQSSECGNEVDHAGKVEADGVEEDAHKAADKCAEIEESVLGRVSLVDDLCDDCVVEALEEAPYDCDDKCA